MQTTLLLTFTFLICAIFVEGNYTPKWSCDFENGLCDWFQSQDDSLDWANDIGQNWNIVDHTKGTLKGRFLSLSLSSLHLETGNGKLTSPLLRPTAKPCQMVFHYRGRFLNDFPLKLVIRKVSTESNKLFHEVLFNTSTISSNWEKGELNITSRVFYQLEIVGYLAHSKDAYIAIDDVMFTNGCVTDEKTELKILKPLSASVYNFPEGVFYYHKQTVCETNTAQYACKMLRKSGLVENSSVIRGFYSKQRICLPLEKTPPGATGCNVNEKCLDAIFWRCKEDYVVKCPAPTHKSCTSSFGTPQCYSYNQQCDYINNCPGGEDEMNCYAYNRCNFEKDFCNWSPKESTALRWERYQDPKAGGYLLRVNSTAAHAETGLARLHLQGFLQGSTNYICAIRFSYRMGQWHNETLKLVLGWQNVNKTVWSNTRARNGEWQREVLELPYPGVFQLWFEAAGETVNSIVIHVANVSFSRECVFLNQSKVWSKELTYPFLCQSGQKIPREHTCNFVPDCRDKSDELNCTHDKGRCTFESSLCTWKVDQNVPITLVRQSNLAGHGLFGPQVDHTTNSTGGYYIYFEARRRSRGDFGQLISHVMQRPSSKKCTFRWFYRMYQDGYFFSDMLTILYFNPISRREQKLWFIKGEQGPKWNQGIVTFDVTSLYFQIILRFERGDSYLSSIAVDDVSFSEECYKFEAYSPITIEQDCNIAKTFFRANKSAAAILFHYEKGIDAGVNCRWSINTDSRLRIGLSVDYLVLDPNDVVSIQSGHLNRSKRTLIGNFSGSVAPFYVVSNLSSMEIKFSASNFNISHGFAMNLFPTDKQETALTFFKPVTDQPIVKYYRACVGPVYTRQQFTGRKTFTTPFSSYGSKTYKKNENCTYQFYVSDGYRLQFIFTTFNTENESDFVEISNDAIIGPQKFSGNLEPFDFVSKINFLSFKFTTNDAIEKEGCIFEVVPTMESTRGPTPYHKAMKPQTSTISPTDRPVQYLTQTCDSYQKRLWPGDKYFGSTVPVDRFSSSARSLNCSWKVPFKTGLKYVIEASYFFVATHMTKFNVSEIAVSPPRTLSSLEGIEKFSNILVTSNGEFRVTASISSSHHRFAHALTYSIYPGCYEASVKNFYFREKNAESKDQCVKACYQRDYRYAFFIEDDKRECYCDDIEPARRKAYMKHPRYCCTSSISKSCNTRGYGKLFITADAIATTMQDKHSKGPSNTTVIAACVSAFIVVAVVVGVAVFFRRRRRQSAAKAPSHASSKKGGSRSPGSSEIAMQPMMS